jgi:hypothetical protein
MPMLYIICSLTAMRGSHPLLLLLLLPLSPPNQIVRAGMRVMRLNFSHATYEEAELRMTNLRKCVGVHNNIYGEPFNVRAVLLDIQVSAKAYRVGHS